MDKTERIQEICDGFRELCSVPYNESLKAYKEEGGKIVGTLYNQVPEELLTAAGVLPVRLRAVGSTGAEAADARFTQVNCSLVKHFYDSAAKGRFDFIDGLVSTNGCDHVRKLHENWVSVLKPAYAHMLCFPKRQGDDLQVTQLTKEIKKLKASLEEYFGVEITDEALKNAIVLHNRTRELQCALYDLRKKENPPITGAQMLAVMMAGTCMPREAYNAQLEELVELCQDAEGITDYKARVVVYGGEIDSIDFFEAIESQGALIVADSLGGYGKRSADMQISLEGDLYANIANAYLMERPAEPRLHGTRAARWEYLEKVAEEANADGYIQTFIPICDLWGYERVMFATEVEKKGLNCLVLDTEYIFTASGQTRTRVQAFVESITEGGR
ncbi:MAG: 2-hydroxyacyl-CoA dehydratase [Eggerthellaceae bacterium]|nr:2-hydroxyacyl-CoA dehydratase [Eggerthellaceae bacterium]